MLAQFIRIPGVDEKTANILWEQGILSLDELLRLHPEELAQIKDLDENKIASILKYAEEQAKTCG
ncbi:MAG: DUF4332 domain-containing protein [Candidatus Altiarchaeota archaeon]|nr:DUF4332 domain-containing protein [Candidatus Altiarchaeota archaeon]